MKSHRVLVTGSALVAACAGAAGAALALAGGPSSGVTSLGPFRLTPFPQTGSCGNTWDVTDYKLTYTVYPQNRDGSYTVVQTAVGHGTSVAGASPEACNGGPNNGATIGGGIHVFEPNDITVQQVSGGTFNPDGQCATPCVFGNGNFTTAFFGASATHQVVSVNYVFTTPSNGQLLVADSVTSGDITGNK
jgi:hypothetical protein